MKNEKCSVVDEDAEVDIDSVVSNSVQARNEHAKDQIEKKYNAKLIDIEELEELGYSDLVKWLKTITRFGNAKRTMLFLKCSEERVVKDSVYIKIFTYEHSYSISATLPEYNGGYLGCTGSCRKSRPGETWTRGSDLADGKYNETTFNRIVKDIVSYEMKNLQCFG